MPLKLTQHNHYGGLCVTINLVMNMQINRLLEFVYILLHRKSVPARELAELLGVSRRTIYRDIEALSTAGIPIYTEKGKYGGVSLLPNSALMKSILSEQEQNEVLTALHGLSNMNVSKAGHVLKKLSTIFNKTVTNWLQVDFSDWGRASDYFYDFKTAILERRVAKFDYYDSKGNKTARCVEPVQLWFKSKSWYMKGFCLTRQSMRVYKLTRVKNLVVTDCHFSERVLSDVLNSLVTNNENVRSEVTIKLRIEPEMKYRLIDDFEEDEIEEQPDGGYIITLPWKEGDWVHGFVLSYAEHIEVLEPEYFRKAIKDRVKKIYERYF